jgi:hypothetical protein
LPFGSEMPAVGCGFLGGLPESKHDGAPTSLGVRTQIGQVIDKRKVPVDLSFYQSDAPLETVLLFTKVVLHR